MMWLLLALLQGSPYMHHGDWLLPNPLVTPGEVRTTSKALVCRQKTKTVRHTSAALKDSVYREYGFSGRNHPRGEIDHLVPLELGGADTRKNLWFQPDGQFQAKDQLENWAHRQVCAGRMDLRVAQITIANDWVELATIQPSR